MESPSLTCPQCRQTLLLPSASDPILPMDGHCVVACAGCHLELETELFPAIYRPAGPRVERKLAGEAEAACFFHPLKQAITPCDACGRFLCELCDIEFDGSHLCPGCIESGARKGKLEKLSRGRTNYDSVALSLAILPLLLIPLIFFTFLTAPAALYMVVRYWRSPLSAVPRTRIRFIFAAVFSILEIMAWVVLIARWMGS